jgi:hypothetical protein
MTLTKADIEIFKELISNIKPKDCSDDIQEIVNIQTTQTEQIKTLVAIVKDTQDTVYGITKPGLVTIVTGLVSAMGILKWIGIVLGGSVIVFIWAIITHSVEIVH